MRQLTDSPHSKYRMLFLPSPYTSRAFPDPQSKVRQQTALDATHSVLTVVSGTYQSPKAAQSSSQLFVLEPAEILSTIARKMGDDPVSDAIRNMHSNHFDNDLFKSTLKLVNDCKDSAQCNKKKVMIKVIF